MPHSNHSNIIAVGVNSVKPLSAFQVYQMKRSNASNVSKKRKILSNGTNGTAIKMVTKTGSAAGVANSNKYMPTSNSTSTLKRRKRKHLISRTPKSGETCVAKREHHEDDPTLLAIDVFGRLITPLDTSTFFLDYWEKRCHHFPHQQHNYFSELCSSASLDEWLRNYSLHYGRNIDVVSYENGIKQVFNVEGRARPFAIWDYFSNGCSIRILNPQTYSAKIHDLITTLQEVFGAMVGANVYLTPPNSQGFAPHFDDIEAFILQLEGRKHWRLYAPKDCDQLSRTSSVNFKRDEIGTPFMKATLEAGDVLYFPRGTIHEASTDADHHSLHITISTYQNCSYADLLQNILPRALEKAAASDVSYRKGLPIHFLKTFGSHQTSSTNTKMQRAATLNQIQHLFTQLFNYIDVDGGVDCLGRRFMQDSMPCLPNDKEADRTCIKAGNRLASNGRVTNRIKFTLKTRVRLIRYYCVRIVSDETDKTEKLYYNTDNGNSYHAEDEQWLELSEELLAPVRSLINAYPNYISIGELPLDSKQLKLQLVSDLWERSLLVTEETLESIC